MDRSTSDGAFLKYLSALAEPHRLAVVRLLIEREDVGAGEIAAHLGDISQPTASRHLATLLNARIVCWERRGKNVYYRLYPGVVDLAEDLAALAALLTSAVRANS